MNAPGAPTAVFSSRLAAAPAAVWAQLVGGDFIARYLALEAAPAALDVVESRAPSALALRLRRDGQAAQIVRWTIEACAGGSRLTVIHEPAPATAGDAIAARLAAAPASALTASRVDGAAGLQAARAYLAETADAVRALAAALAPRAGYEPPAGGGFSLAEHLWHLADIETLGWQPRFERLLAETRPRLRGVDGDRLAVEGRYRDKPWRGAARRFVAARRRTLRSLRQFDVAVLARPVWFAGRSATAGDVLAAMVAHDREHRAEMADLWAATLPEKR